MFIVNLYMKCSDIYVVDCYVILFFFLSINLFGIIKFVFLDFRWLWDYIKIVLWCVYYVFVYDINRGK